MSPVVVGVFVGGASRRMGGEPKGLLPAPGEPQESLVGRLVRIAREEKLDVVLVGDATPYASLGVPALADDPPDTGPLGGLAALLAHAGDRAAIAIACDMPHVSADDILRLATSLVSSPVLAARRGDLWEPFFARYDSRRVLPDLRRAISEGVRSFQDFFARIRVTEHSLGASADRVLADWDEPADRWR